MMISHPPHSYICIVNISCLSFVALRFEHSLFILLLFVQNIEDVNSPPLWMGLC